MIYLLLCIISSTLIFVIFKFLGRYKIPVLPVIVYNYLFASATGFILTGNQIFTLLSKSADWISLSIIIGILFIVMFFVVGKSSQVAGISVTTVASKMSVVTPITFSILSDPLDDLSLLKSTGIITALIAVFLTIYRKKTLDVERSAIFYPVLLFFGMGVVDSLVKYSQLHFIEDSRLAIFSAVLFLIAFICGLLIISFNKKKRKHIYSFKTLYWGLFLGLSNFGSIYFIIRALNFKNVSGNGIDSSIIFGVNNTGIVVLSVLAGYIIFKEKLRVINYLGIVLAIIAIILFSYA